MPEYVRYGMVFPVQIFDGSNQADLWAEMVQTWPNMTVTASSAPGASATFTVVTDLPNNGPQTLDFAVGDGYNRIGPGYGHMPQTLLEDIQFVQFESFVDNRVAALIPQPALAVGYEITPNLGAGASATVQVPMVPDLPDAGYNVAVALAGSSQLLGSLRILGHTVVSASAVNVDVENTNGLLALGGATVLVTALHNG